MPKHTESTGCGFEKSLEPLKSIRAWQTELRPASVFAKASPRQVGFWNRFAPGGAVAERVSVQCLRVFKC